MLVFTLKFVALYTCSCLFSLYIAKVKYVTFIDGKLCLGSEKKLHWLPVCILTCHTILYLCCSIRLFIFCLRTTFLVLSGHSFVTYISFYYNTDVPEMEKMTSKPRHSVAVAGVVWLTVFLCTISFTLQNKYFY